MGKGLAWSESETIQLCLSWLEVSEDAVRGAGQKKSTFSSRLYPLAGKQQTTRQGSTNGVRDNGTMEEIAARSNEVL
ncbi:hypothetical protein L917_04643, partial [Phytophthora nicotianae]